MLEVSIRSAALIAWWLLVNLHGAKLAHLLHTLGSEKGWQRTTCARSLLCSCTYEPTVVNRCRFSGHRSHRDTRGTARSCGSWSSRSRAPCPSGCRVSRVCPGVGLIGPFEKDAYLTCLPCCKTGTQRKRQVIYPWLGINPLLAEAGKAGAERDQGTLLQGSIASFLSLRHPAIHSRISET
jgi:hypothetical protein